MKYGSLLSILVVIVLLAAIMPTSVISLSLAQPPPPPPSVRINLTADTYTIQVGDVTVIRAFVTDLSGNPKPNETVNFTTTLGTITPASNKTDTNGVTIAHLQGTSDGIANVTAVIGAIQSNIIEVEIIGAGGTPTPSPTPSGGEGEVTTTLTSMPSPTVTPGVNATPSPSPETTLTVTPTVTVSPTPAATVSPTPSPTKKPLIQGFEAVFAIASLLAVAYLVLRRGREA